MNKNEFENMLESAFEKNGIGNLLNKTICEQLFLFADFLLAENKKYNLTAIKNFPDVIYKHFVDSLLISSFILQNASLIDIGCGAGFPSLPLAIARPDLNITALDSNYKKILFIDSCISILGLVNITPICARAEQKAREHDFRDSFDYSIARAVSSLPVLVELCTPFLRPCGRFLAMKGPDGSDDFRKAKNYLHNLNVGEDKLLAYKLYTDSTIEARTLISIEKLGKTPDNFPRNYAQITKKPLE